MKSWFQILIIAMISNFSGAVNLQNGSFENNSGNGSTPDNWTKDFSCYGAYDGAYVTGSYCLHPGNGGPPGGAYQDISTVTGAWYNVTLWAQNFGGAAGSGNVKVLIGNPGTDTYTFENGTSKTTAYSLTGLVAKNFTTSASWTQFSFAVQAVGTTTRVGVYNAPFSGSFSTNVDDVNVSAASAVSIITSPSGVVADPNATFTVSAAAAQSYQWYKVGSPDTALNDGGRYSGTHTNKLTISNAVLSDEGRYYVIASNTLPTQAASASAQLWTKRLIGYWKLDGNVLDSVAGTVAGAPTHDGSIAINNTIIGLDFGGNSDNHFNNITDTSGSVSIAAGSVIDIGGVVVPGVAIGISGLKWVNNDGTDNGGLAYPFDYSNVDDWMGADSYNPITITFSGLQDSKAYDFIVHAGWAGGIDFGIEVSSSDGKVSNVINTTPAGAPNIGTITGARPSGGVLQFTVETTNVSSTVINAAVLSTSTASVSPSYTGGINGNAIVFNNENAYVQIADANFFNFYPYGFSSNVWHKSNTAIDWRLPFSKVSLSPRGGWLFGVNSSTSKEVSLIIEGGGAWLTSGNAATDVNNRDGQWHMMTATYDSKTSILRLYSDGKYVSQASVNIAALPLATEPLSIGGRLGEHAVSGNIDDARVYSYALSSTEVAQLYTNFKTGSSVCITDTDPTFVRLDLNNDCKIGFADFAKFAQKWLNCMLVPASACN